MKMQIGRILLGTLFAGLAAWLFEGGHQWTAIFPGTWALLLFLRFLPLSVWKRWEAENRPPQG